MKQDNNPFAAYPVIARMPPAKALTKLDEVDPEAAAEARTALASTPASPQVMGFSFFQGEPKPWQHSSHAFGFIGRSGSVGGQLDISDVGSMTSDGSLKDSRINISLNYLRVASYPGKGTHRVLFDFYAQNQLPGTPESVHFNSTYRVLEGERSGIRGYPIFIGLSVGKQGVAFRCFTVNVKNDQDEAFLGFLDSDLFKGGLKLATSLQPAIAPLSGMTVALTKAIAGRHQNVPVQDFYLGLDFDNTPGGARLACGSYVAVQIPERDELIWDWTDWLFDSLSGHIVNRNNNKELIPFNYLVFGISRYEET